MQRIVTHRRNPEANSANLRFQCGRSLRSWISIFAMPNIEIENVRKTLMLYITTSCRTSPRECRSAASEATPMRTMPFCVVRRSERDANRRGAQ